MFDLDAKMKEIHPNIFHLLGKLREQLVRTTITSQWVWWRFESPASPLFAHVLVQAQIKENIKAPRH